MLIIFIILMAPSKVSAVSCSSVPISGNYTVSSSCEFSGTVDGVDAGSGTTNTATITVNSGQTLTISASQTVVFGGSITINGSISIVNTGQIRQTTLWMTDADTDNYPSSTTQTAQATAPTSGRRRNLMTSISSADCNDASGTVWQNSTCYSSTDVDGDGYYATSASVCSGASCTGNTGSQDCNDSNANVKPGQTTYFTVQDSRPSWDYDCNGTGDKQYATDYAEPYGNIGFTVGDCATPCRIAASVSNPANCGGTWNHCLTDSGSNTCWTFSGCNTNAYPTCLTWETWTQGCR